MAKNNGNYTFKFEHQDDPDYPSSLEILHKITPRNPHVKNLLEKEVTTNEKLVFLQTVIDLVRYVLTAAPNNGVSAYQEMFGAEVEINQFKSLLFDEKIGLLEGIRQYNKENPQATEFQDKSNEASVEKELWDQPNEDLSKNYIQQNVHMNLKDGKHEDPAFLERLFKDNVFQLTTEEYLLLRKSIYLSNAGIYFYQRGWDPNISQSPQRIAKLVVDNVVWRWVYKPEKTKWEDVIESAKCGSLFDYGLDKMGNPMIYMVVGREDLSRKLDDRATLLRFRHLCLCFEHIMNRLYDGSSQNYLGQEKSEFLGSAPFQITWVVDIKDASLSIDLVKKIKFIFDLLGFYYPERSEIVFVMNIPWMAKMLWAVISQFLTQRQRNQYQFLSDPFLTKLTQNIEPKYVGGDLAISGVGANTESDYTFDLGSRIKACNKRPVMTKWVDE